MKNGKFSCLDALGTNFEAANRLVVGVAVKLARKYGCLECAGDLVSEAWVSLLECARRFDAGRGVDFLAYARHDVWWALNRWCKSEWAWRFRNLGTSNELEDVGAREAVFEGSAYYSCSPEELAQLRERSKLLRRALQFSRLRFEDCYGYCDPAQRHFLGHGHRSTTYRNCRRAYERLRVHVLREFRDDGVEAAMAA
ncbi:MAG: sigma factor [Bradymonadales bacterium]